MSRKRFTVELVLDVVAKDETDAEQIGRSLCRFGVREARGIEGAVVADIRPDDSWDERQPADSQPEETTT